MNKRIIVAAAFVASILVLGVSGAYALMFGLTPVNSNDIWGQFGDFFGGTLNPLFAMLAFLALLWSIALQHEELQRASQHLSKQSDLAQKQLEQLANDRLNQELVQVIKDIDTRLNKLLDVVVSPSGSEPVATVAMMVAESERLALHGGHSGSYSNFVVLAKDNGSVVEALIREISSLVEDMRGFLEQLSRFRSGSYAPVIIYYANKVYRLLYMLEDIGCVPPDSRQFFATVGDPHN